MAKNEYGSKLKDYITGHYKENDVSDVDFLRATKELLTRGESPDFEDTYVLWFICETNKIRPGIVELLLQSGANPNGKRGDTMFASMERANMEYAELLLQYGYKLSFMQPGHLEHLFQRDPLTAFKIKDLFRKYTTETNKPTLETQVVLAQLNTAHHDYNYANIDNSHF